MTGYAAVRRIQRTDIRLGLAYSSPWGEPGDRPRVEIEDLVGDATLERWRERLDDLRTVWRQTTFFLFDGEGWR